MKNSGVKSNVGTEYRGIHCFCGHDAGLWTAAHHVLDKAWDRVHLKLLFWQNSKAELTTPCCNLISAERMSQSCVQHLATIWALICVFIVRSSGSYFTRLPEILLQPGNIWKTSDTKVKHFLFEHTSTAPGIRRVPKWHTTTETVRWFYWETMHVGTVSCASAFNVQAVCFIFHQTGRGLYQTAIYFSAEAAVQWWTNTQNNNWMNLIGRRKLAHWD